MNSGECCFRFDISDLILAEDQQTTNRSLRQCPIFRVLLMDWCSRNLLSWRLSNCIDADFCVEALKEAIAEHDAPEIFNSDQGIQFTSGAWIDVLTDAKNKISMDGKAVAVVEIRMRVSERP